MSIRVLLADDHPVVRDGLRLVLQRDGRDIVVVGEASDGLQVCKLAEKTSAQIIILDIAMPKLNGIEVARDLRQCLPAAKVIMLSLHHTRDLVEAALAAGARGYLSKETATCHLVDAITAVHAGGHYLCPRVAHCVADATLMGKPRARQRAPLWAALTRQERVVLQLIAEGHSNREIGAMLNRSIHTIHAHRSNLMAKLNIHKQADLIRYAIKSGIATIWFVSLLWGRGAVLPPFPLSG